MSWSLRGKHASDFESFLRRIKVCKEGRLTIVFTRSKGPNRIKFVQSFRQLPVRIFGAARPISVEISWVQHLLNLFLGFRYLVNVLLLVFLVVQAEKLLTEALSCVVAAEYSELDKQLRGVSQTHSISRFKGHPVEDLRVPEVPLAVSSFVHKDKEVVKVDRVETTLLLLDQDELNVVSETRRLNGNRLALRYFFLQPRLLFKVFEEDKQDKLLPPVIKLRLLLVVLADEINQLRD